MTVWLGRQEAVARFGAFQNYLTKGEATGQAGVFKDDDEESVDGDETESGGDVVVGSTSQLRYTLAAKPGFPSLRIDAIKSDFHACTFLDCLSTFIRRLYPPPSVPLLPNTLDFFNLFKRLTISRTSLPAAGSSLLVDRIRTTPKVTGDRSKAKSATAHFDTVLVQTDNRDNQHTKGTWLEGKVFVLSNIREFSERFRQVYVLRRCGPFFEVPAHLRRPTIPSHLVYIDWFTRFRSPDRDSHLYSVTRSYRSNVPVAEIIPITSIVSACYLTPKFGTKFHPAQWNSDNVLEECKAFFLTKHINLDTFLRLEGHIV